MVQDPASAQYVEATYLIVEMVSDENQSIQLQLDFATHKSIEAEWDAGTSFANIDAAIDTEMAGVDTTGDDDLPTDIRTGKEGYTFTG
jgi:hypothetical protein